MWRSFALTFLLFWIVPVGAQPIRTAADRPFTPSQADSVARLEILRIDDQPAIHGRGVVIASLADNEAFDAEIGGYALPDDYEVYLCAKPDDAVAYRCFGAARKERRETGDVWVVVDARLSAAATQTRQFSLRAVARRKGQALPDPVTSLDGFDALSSPAVQIAVLKWTVGERLMLGTVSGRTIGPTRELSVEPTGDVSGVLPPDVLPPDVQGQVYVMLHWVGTNVWWVVATETRGRIFYARDVRFSRPGYPHWRHVDAIAFVTHETLQTGPVDYAAVSARFKAVSSTVRLWVQDEPTPPPARTGTVTVVSYTCDDGVPRRVSASTGVLQFTSPECAMEAKVEGLAQGHSVYAAITAAGGAEFIVQDGPAVYIGGARWMLPRVRLVTRDANVAQFYLWVFSASVNLPSGPIDYATWQRAAVAPSQRFVVRSTAAATSSSTADITLEIDPASDPLRRVEVQAHDLPPWLTVWVGAQWGEAGPWTFIQAQRQSETRWVMPGFPARPRDIQRDYQRDYQRDGQRVSQHDGHDAGPARMVAIATTGPIDPAQRDFASWSRSAWRTSDFIELPAPAARPALHAVSDGSSSAGPQLLESPWQPSLVRTVLFILLTLAMLQYFSGASERLFAANRDVCGRAQQYVTSAFPGMPRPDPVKTVLGLIMLGLGLYGIVAYYPLYTNVLKSALGLSASSSSSLALLLITFIGLTGIVAHVTYSCWPGERRRSFVFALVFTLVVLMAACLLAFQGLIYAGFYKAHSPADSLIPFALGAAAVFISAVEMLVAFWVFQLAIEAATWILFHLLLIGPIWLLKSLSGGMALLFAHMPRRKDADEHRKDADTQPTAQPRASADNQTGGTL